MKSDPFRDSAAFVSASQLPRPRVCQSFLLFLRMVLVLLLLGTATEHAGAAVHAMPAGAAGHLVVGAVELQRACWVLDKAAVMADHAAQLEQAHELSLGGAELPGKVRERLGDSLRLVRLLRRWISSTGAALDQLFREGSNQSQSLAALEKLLDPSAAPANSSELQVLFSPDPWSGHCEEEAVIRQLWAAGERVRGELGRVEAELAEQAPVVFKAREERATAAGEVEALELLLAKEATEHSSRKETVRGVFNASLQVEKVLWGEVALRKQVILVLARTMWEARRQFAERHTGLQDEGRLEAAKERLRRADRGLLEATQQLQGLSEARGEVEEMLRKHVKSVLSQCLLPDPHAPRSRYARFEHASPAASAVQLSFQVGNFFTRSVSGTIPALREVLLEALKDLRSGADMMKFSRAPELSRWWEWAPDPAQGDAFLGFDGFTERYKSALEAYDSELTHGGRVAALHSMWTRWNEIAGLALPTSPVDVTALPGSASIA